MHTKHGNISPRPGFSRAVDDWVQYLEVNKGRSPLTAAKYAGHLAKLEQYANESGLDPWDLSLEQLEHFAGLVAHSMGLKPRSRRPLVAALRGFFQWAARAGHVNESAARGLEYPSHGRRLPRPAQLATAEKLLMQPDITTFTGLRDAAMIATLIGCGLRVSGLCNMNRGHLVLTEIDGAERMILVVSEKGNHERHQPVPVEAAVLIRAYLASPELLEIDANLESGDQVMWVTTNNRLVAPEDYHGEVRRISTRTVHDMIATYGDRAGLPKDQCHPHALRHLFATELAESDIDIQQRQALMGHKDMRSTAIYTHVAIRRQVRAVDTGNPLTKMKGTVVQDARRLAEKLKARAPLSPTGS